jgi:hypothetical protein
VRGRPSTISGATISSSSISGWRAYQSSISSRRISSIVHMPSSVAVPAWLSRASLWPACSSRSSPSCQPSAPKWLSPVAALAFSITLAAVVIVLSLAR